MTATRCPAAVSRPANGGPGLTGADDDGVEGLRLRVAVGHSAAAAATMAKAPQQGHRILEKRDRQIFSAVLGYQRAARPVAPDGAEHSADDAAPQRGPRDLTRPSR